MTANAEYFDSTINRDLLLFKVDGFNWRFPRILHNRYEIEGIFALGGFGVLLKARDTRVFKRLVLVKTAIPDKLHLSTRNNMGLAGHVEELRRRVGWERKALLHAKLRGITGIPTLVDWFNEVSPTIRGPHIDEDGSEFYHEEQSSWQDIPHLVLGFFDGQPLEQYVKMKPVQIMKNPEGYLRYIANYLGELLRNFHAQREFDSVKLFMVYQDLKPANILVSPTEKRVSLIDFGGVAFRTSKGVINAQVFTRGFAPPEATEHPFDWQKVAPTWDIYSLGATICSLSQSLSVEAHLSGAFKNLWKKCMEPEPSMRFSSMHALLDAMKALPPTKSADAEGNSNH